jgi:hypothetical protein
MGSKWLNCHENRSNSPLTGEPIADPFGFLPRLRTATKLGFKHPK